MISLDHTATIALADQLLEAIRAHLKQRPQTPDANFEALNALAIATAPIITSARLTGHEATARQFFCDALNNQVDQNARAAGDEAS